MILRPIPSSNEMLPVIGLGTWKQFDVGSSADVRTPLEEVIAEMSKTGGMLIDSSPMYGQSEEVVGDLTGDPKISEKFFYATKVWISGKKNGIDQMNESLRKMRRTTMDLMQIHNLLDWQVHLETLKQWKSDGKIRYIGITHYQSSSHNDLEQIIKANTMDFIQFNYSIRSRNAERSLLNTAMDRGVAVIINEPLEKGKLFAAVNRKPIPPWVSEYGISSWGTFFLKYIIAHPAVTTVIPATSNVHHLADNMAAGEGLLPDEKGRKRMVEFIEQL